MLSSMDRKTQYLEAVADYLLAHGLKAASLRPMAKAIGTSDRMLIYHFGSKAELMEAALLRTSERLFERLQGDWQDTSSPSQALGAVFGALSGPELRGYSALWQDIIAGAMRGDAVCRRAGARMVEGYMPWLTDRMGDPDLAALTLAVIDGAAQLQAVDRDDDVRRALTAYLKLLESSR